ncbi:hypothetical protein YC2023_072714 [Brassica napus]
MAPLTPLPQLLHDDSLCSPHNPPTLSPSPFNPRPQRRKSRSSLSPFLRRRPHILLGHQTHLAVQLGRRKMRQQQSHRPPSPGISLSGTIPNGVFGNLTRLRTLSLRLNTLAGSLPLDLTTSSDLRHLYLQGNKFSGKYPRACSVSQTS